MLTSISLQHNGAFLVLWWLKVSFGVPFVSSGPFSGGSSGLKFQWYLSGGDLNVFFVFLHPLQEKLAQLSRGLRMG